MENIVAKGKINIKEPFLLLQHCFQKLSVAEEKPECWKGVILVSTHVQVMYFLLTKLTPSHIQKICSNRLLKAYIQKHEDSL